MGHQVRVPVFGVFRFQSLVAVKQEAETLPEVVINKLGLSARGTCQ